MTIKVAAIEHLTLTVSDIAQTVAFYQKVLGMTMTIYGEGEVALQFGRQQFKLRTPGDDFYGVAQSQTTAADITLVIEGSLRQATQHLRALDVEVLEGPSTTSLSKGQFESVKFLDPDQNIIEIGCFIK